MMNNPRAYVGWCDMSDETSNLTQAQIEQLRSLVEILTKQNKIMKDILRYQGVHDLEKIFYDCPLPYDEDLSTPGGYNAPSNPKKIIEDNKRAVDDFVNYIGPLGSSVERRKQNERDSDKS